MTHNTLPITFRYLTKQWLVQLALNVLVPPIPFWDKWFTKARDLKRLWNIMLNQNALGNLITNLATADPPNPVLALWSPLLEYGSHWIR